MKKKGKSQAHKQRLHTASVKRRQAKRAAKSKATKHTSQPKNKQRGQGMSIGQLRAMGAVFQAMMPGLNTDVAAVNQVVTQGKRGVRTSER